MAKQDSSAKPSEAVISPTPQTVDEFVESGWTHYSKKEYFRAEADFQKALEMSPGNVDVLYPLGMAQQASGRIQEAIHTFEKTIKLLEDTPLDNQARTHMLIRLAKGHINRMKTGDWKLDEV